jgi:hypothetical protein
MKRLSFLLIICAISVLVLVLHVTALKYFLYWRIRWFDIPVHFLGGLTIGFLSVVPVIFSRTKDDSIKTIAVFSALVVSLLWELFEFKIGLSRLSHRFFYDTVSDISSGVIGGFVSAWLSVKLIRIQNNNV